MLGFGALARFRGTPPSSNRRATEKPDRLIGKGALVICHGRYMVTVPIRDCTHLARPDIQRNEFGAGALATASSNARMIGGRARSCGRRRGARPGLSGALRESRIANGGPLRRPKRHGRPSQRAAPVRASARPRDQTDAAPARRSCGATACGTQAGPKPGARAWATRSKRGSCAPAQAAKRMRTTSDGKPQGKNGPNAQACSVHPRVVAAGCLAPLRNERPALAPGRGFEAILARARSAEENARPFGTNASSGQTSLPAPHLQRTTRLTMQAKHCILAGAIRRQVHSHRGSFKKTGVNRRPWGGILPANRMGKGGGRLRRPYASTNAH